MLVRSKKGPLSGSLHNTSNIRAVRGLSKTSNAVFDITPSFVLSRSPFSSVSERSCTLTVLMASGRRSSFSSLSSGRDSNTSSRSPLIGANDDVDGTSDSHLILVHDESEELSNIHFDFSSDDDDDLSDALSSQLDRIKASPIPPLPSTLVLLYLLSPLLKLGPMLIPSADIPLKYSIPAVFVFALFTLLSRQLWYMLAKYVRKADLEEVVLDAFARGRGKEGRRRVLRACVRVAGAAFACILATVYLRRQYLYSCCTHLLLHPLTACHLNVRTDMSCI